MHTERAHVQPSEKLFDQPQAEFRVGYLHTRMRTTGASEARDFQCLDESPCCQHCRGKSLKSTFCVVVNKLVK